MYGVSEDVTKTNILEHVTPYDIFCFYIPWFVPHRTIKTPFKNESRGSFYATVFPKGYIWFKDYGRNIKGDCFNLVMELFDCNFSEAINRINIDMGLGLGDSGITDIGATNNRTLVHKEYQPSPQQDANIQLKYRDWTIDDLQFWADYGVDKLTLDFYQIKPIRAYWIREMKFTTNKLAYAWPSGGKWKVYQPNSKLHKWYGDITAPQGEDYLPQYGEILLLQSSMKDIAACKARYNIPGVASISETTPFDSIDLSLYERRFNRICVLFDNDEAGIQSSTSTCIERGYENIILPKTSISKMKDPSDFVYYRKEKILDDVFKSYGLI